MTQPRLVGPLPVAYALLGCFFLAERLLRQGPDAASLEAGTTDQGTTRAIGRAFGQSLFALAVAPLIIYRPYKEAACPWRDAVSAWWYPTSDPWVGVSETLSG